MDKKRKQHYVWRYYLKPWTRNEKIFCLRHNEIFETNLMNIGNKRDFYRIQEIYANDIDLVKKLFVEKPVNPLIKKLHKRWIRLFTFHFKIKKVLERLGFNQNEISRIFDVRLNNFEEDIHCKIENSARCYLEFLLNENNGFYKNEQDNINFNFYLAVQYLRTNRMKSKVIDSMVGIFPPSIWNVSTFIIATNIGYELSRRKGLIKCCILKNNTKIPFITGDQPIINSLADYESDTMVTDYEFYYPLSPSLSLLLTEDNRYNSDLVTLTESEVIRYNDLISKASYEQLYANQKTVLSRYVISKQLP